MTRERIAIIEDDPFFADCLKMKLQISDNLDIEVYSNPDEFAEKITTKEQVNRFDFILVDYLYGKFTASHKGVASYLVDDLAYTGKIFLWTLEDERNIKFKDDYDAILPKKYFSLEQLKTIAKSC